MLVKGKKLKLPRAKIREKARTRVKAGPQTPLSFSSCKLLIQGLPSHKLKILVFVVFLFFFIFYLCLLFLYFLFVKEMYHTFVINENVHFTSYVMINNGKLI